MEFNDYNQVWPTYIDIILTFIRWFIGLIFGAFMGILLAALDGLFHNINKNYSKLLIIIGDFFRALPIIALVPIIQLISVSEQWKIGLIAWAVMFPVWLSINQARNKKMTDSEISLLGIGMKRIDFIKHYHFPKALSGLLVGIDIGIGVAWLSVVAAEWIGTYSTGFWAGGLGYKIMRAHDANNWIGMMSCLILFGILGITSSKLWRKGISSYRKVKLLWGHEKQ